MSVNQSECAAVLLCHTSILFNDFNNFNTRKIVNDVVTPGSNLNVTTTTERLFEHFYKMFVPYGIQLCLPISVPVSPTILRVWRSLGIF